MPIQVRTVYGWLDSVAPFDTAEAFDNVGLVVGTLSAPVERLLFCVDVTEDVVREAAVLDAQLIVSHHPLMFGGVSRIDYDVPEGRTLCALLEARLNVIVAHTNWDKAPGGVADSLAEALGLEEIIQGDEYVRVGRLRNLMMPDAFAAHVQKTLGANVRRYGKCATQISRVAVGPGACGDRAEAAVKHGAQAFVVGEIKHHELLFACGQGLMVFDAGHFASEAVGMTALYHRFQADAAKNLWQAQPLLYSKAPYLGA